MYRDLRLLPAILLFVIPLTALAVDCGVDEKVYPDQLFPRVKLVTSLGEIIIELDRRRAPVTVNNFLRYVRDKRYEGTVFHRVMPDFVVQGGGYRPDFSSIDTYPPIFNESGNGLTNTPRSVAMARHDDPNSATSQFYFNLSENDSLDPQRRHWGYTVFGTVAEGWEVVEAIAAVETGFAELLNATDVPVEAVILSKVELLPAEF
jgi:peptidyl-prolyl cis-trans isomerase A (cyclophilin A)